MSQLRIKPTRAADKQCALSRVRKICHKSAPAGYVIAHNLAISADGLQALLAGDKERCGRAADWPDFQPLAEDAWNAIWPLLAPQSRTQSLLTILLDALNGGLCSIFGLGDSLMSLTALEGFVGLGDQCKPYDKMLHGPRGQREAAALALGALPTNRTAAREHGRIGRLRQQPSSPNWADRSPAPTKSARAGAVTFAPPGVWSSCSPSLSHTGIDLQPCCASKVLARDCDDSSDVRRMQEHAAPAPGGLKLISPDPRSRWR